MNWLLGNGRDGAVWGGDISRRRVYWAQIVKHAFLDKIMKRKRLRVVFLEHLCEHLRILGPHLLVGVGGREGVTPGLEGFLK